MTFKHTKFADSVTMRSLEKVAHERGWITNDPLTKTASGPDLNPSFNFMENIVKLCSGLRHSGFDKYADELESAFFTYKQADKTYDVSNETGEDLVDAAHPDGGHQMEGVEGDAFVETILEKHLKMLDVTNKESKAKLASVLDIMSAVKVVLSQSPAAEELLEQINVEMNRVNAIVDRITSMSNSELTFSINSYQNSIHKLTSNPTKDKLKELQSTLTNLSKRLDPSGINKYTTFGAAGLSEDTWSKVESMLNAAQASTTKAMNLREKYNMAATPDFSGQTDQPRAPTQLSEVEVVASPLIQKSLALISKLKAFKSIGGVARNQSATNWIASEVKEIQDLMKRFSSVPEGQEASVEKFLEKELAEKESEVNQFAATWAQ